MVFTQLKRKISLKFEWFKRKFSSSKPDPLIPAARLTATVPVPQSSTPTLTPPTSAIPAIVGGTSVAAVPVPIQQSSAPTLLPQNPDTPTITGRISPNTITAIPVPVPQSYAPELLPQNRAVPATAGSPSSNIGTVIPATLTPQSSPSTPPSPGPGPSQGTPRTTLTLWDQAVAKLDAESLRYIDFQQDKIQIVDELFQATEKMKNIREGAEWSYKNRRGETKSVRESVGTFLANFKKFLPLGDHAVSQAPAIVSFAWGGFKILLQVITAGVENLTIIFESFDNISRILSHCRIYEDLYLEMKLKAAPLLKASLVNLYVSVLEYLCYVRRHLGRNTAAQYLQRAWDGIWMNLNGLLDTITLRETELMKEADLAAKEGQSKQLKSLLEIRQPIREIERKVGDIYTHIEETQRENILVWLSGVKFFDHHSGFSSLRREGTGEWLVKHKLFLNWKKSEISSILWLHGIAGSGKTMLMSKVIDTLESEPPTHALDEPGAQPKKSALAYFYCNYKEDDRNDPAPILRTLVKQLCMMAPEGKFPKLVSSIYEKRNVSGQLTLGECRAILLKLSAGFSETTIIIDALDECNRSTRRLLLVALKDLLASPYLVKIFVASRDDDDLTRILARFPGVRIGADNTRDIELYINSQINDRIANEELLCGNVDPKLKEFIILTLREKACGMFLWVHFQILKICEQVTPSGIRAILSTLPSDLNETYSEIMKKIKPKEPAGELAEKALKWLLCAVRPLSPSELIMAISVDPKTGKMDTEGLTVGMILGICQNLVVFDEELDVLRFAHFSVQEFLLGQFKLKECHKSAADVCLTVLMHHNATKSPALVNYSTFHWPVHAKSSEDGCETLSDLCEEFLKPSCLAYKAWNWTVSRQISDLTPKISETIAPLIVASYYQLDDILKSLLNAGANPNTCNAELRTPLHFAAVHGGENTTRLLLEKGANMNSRDERGRTPLSRAAQFGHEKVIETLLAAKGVDIDSDKAGRTPFSWAIGNKHERSVQVLLEKGGVDLNSPDGRGWTPLLWAMANGCGKCVGMILGMRGVDLNGQGGRGRTPLLWAMAKGLEIWVGMLIEKEGVDLNGRDGSGQTPLICAMDTGNERWVGMLIKKEGVDLNRQDNKGRTPLLCAMDIGHERWVGMLIEKEGVDLNRQDNKGRTPLICAMDIGHERWVGMLIEKEGVDLNREDNKGRTPLICAMDIGHERWVGILIEKEGVDLNIQDGRGRIPLLWAMDNEHDGLVGALLGKKRVHIDIRDISGRTPLTCAAERGYENVVWTLLGKGAEVNNRDTVYGRTPLTWAAERGYENVVWTLLGKGAEVNNRDTVYGRTPLSQAAGSGHEKVVKMLLEKGAEVDSRDTEYGRTPLSRAAESGHQKVAKILLEKGAEVDSRDTEYGQTPLSLAAENGHENVVEMFLERGAEVDGRDTEYGRTPLSWAAESGHEEVVRMLLETDGADVNSKDSESGQTPLSSAAENGHLEVVKMLLGKGAEAESKDNSGRTPLSWAAEGGYEEVVKILLERKEVVDGVDCKDTEYGRTPLLWAVKNGHVEVVRMLLAEEKVDVNSSDKTGRTPLSHACDTTVCELLESKGATNSGIICESDESDESEETEDTDGGEDGSGSSSD